MTSTDHNHCGGDSHGTGLHLEPEARAILQRGLDQLLEMTEGLEFRPTCSQTHPLPLACLAYKSVPSVASIRDDVKARAADDPVSVLENALALLELYECNQGDIGEYVLEDMPFVMACFASKRCNGWICLVGDGDGEALAGDINTRWKFKFFSGPARATGIYVLANMLARYAYIYGRIRYGDAHELSHFVEEHCPGLLVCCGEMTDLELTLSLAAMKMGIPAVVPAQYPFPLGRTLRYDDVAEIPDAVVGFANIRRLLDTPDVPPYPQYCDSENIKEDVTPGAIWADTPESFFIVRKGKVASTGFTVDGQPTGPMGVTVTIDAEPMDAFDRRHIEMRIAGKLALMSGVGVQYDGQKFKLLLGEAAELTGEKIGEVLIAAVRHEFPKLSKIHVEIVFDAQHLADLSDGAAEAKADRQVEIDAATEEAIGQFFGCVGCSPFAPDHMCVVTPQRPPQCSRMFAGIKTGALYGYDDMSSIHHSKLHRDINSFFAIDKGRCLDPVSGEWEGVNEKLAQITHGRTTRVQLHALESFPHTGCACFRMIMFKTDKPIDGVGIMSAGYEGKCPDGRSWKDLHYALTGKQAPGMAGASPNYLRSKKFLAAHRGWQSIVWVDPKIAAIMGDDLPDHVAVD